MCSERSTSRHLEGIAAGHIGLDRSADLGKQGLHGLSHFRGSREKRGVSC